MYLIDRPAQDGHVGQGLVHGGVAPGVVPVLVRRQHHRHGGAQGFRGRQDLIGLDFVG